MKWSRPLEKQKLDLVKGLPEISSWFISVGKKKDQKNNNNKKTTPKPLRSLLWVIRQLSNCNMCVCRYQIQSGWFSGGYRMSSVQ